MKTKTVASAVLAINGAVMLTAAPVMAGPVLDSLESLLEHARLTSQ